MSMMNSPLPPALAREPKSALAQEPKSGMSRPPAKQSKFLGMGIALMILLIAVIPLFFMFYPEYERSQILETGLPGQAEIISVKPTGSTFNDQPQVRILLRVTPESGEVFESTATMIINPFYASQFQKGMTVQVRYDAEDHSKIAIEETEDGTR